MSEILAVVEIDVSNSPTNPTRAWTDVTAWGGVNRVRAASWTRDGRSLETDRTQPGSASVTLSNHDGVFDRNNQAGPFYAGLNRDFWFRISVVINGVTYPRWTGVKSAARGSRPAGIDRFVTLSGSSAMKALELFPLSGLSYDPETPGPRVTSVLADVGMSAGTIDPGKPSLTFPAVSFLETDTTSALAHLQAVEQDERGLLFSDALGEMVFQDRYYRSNLFPAGPVATIGESEGDIRYVEGDLNDETENVWNVVAVTPAVGAIQVAEDSLSEDDNFARRLDQSMLAESESEALSNAEWYAQRFSQPLPYLPDLEIVGARDPSTWPTIMGAANSELFEWVGGDNDIQVNLERVSESWSAGELKVTWSLSPADRGLLWRLGVAGQSELGPTTRLG